MGSPLKAIAPTESQANVPLIVELANSPAMRECGQWFVREKQWIHDQHLQLCRIAAPTFLEGKRAQWMVTAFKSMGYDASIDRAGNVVAHSGPLTRGPYLAVTAHLDTVLAPRSPEEIKVDPDGTLHGPGVSDNGAGLAALLALAKVLKCCGQSDTAGASLLFVANVGEEGEGNLSGMRFLCRQFSLAPRIRSFVVLDGPTTDHITCQALASRRFEISYTGNGGHSWSDFGIGNPVHALSRAIFYFLETAGSLPPGSPRISYNFGMIEGGSSINSIPSEARAKVDVRSESTARIEALIEILSASVDRSLQVENERAMGGRVTAKLKEIGSRPGGRLSPDAYMLRAIRSVDSHLGIRAVLDCASTDANIPLSLGIPAVSIGSGGQGGAAHTAGEWFHPDGREVGLRRIVLFLMALLMEPA